MRCSAESKVVSRRHSPRNQLVARALLEAGLGTLLLDLLTRDEEWEDAVTGALRFDIGLLARRLVAVTYWLESHEETARLMTGLFGAGTACGAALVAAAALGDRIPVVVSRGGRPDLAGDALPRVRCPTLLIVGGEDDVVLRLNEEAAGRMRCENDLRIVTGATHLLRNPARSSRMWNGLRVGFAGTWEAGGVHDASRGYRF